MKYRDLGRSGPLVSRLCLGTMTFGNAQWGCDQATVERHRRRFVEGWGNFIDTADVLLSAVFPKTCWASP